MLHHLQGQTDDTRAAILLANLILARAAEQGQITSIEHEFIDIVEVCILPAVRVAQQWYAIERADGDQQQLIRDTLVIVGQAIEVYTARALALLPPQLVAQGRAQVADENCRAAI